jgi:hypothetical protein
MPMLAERTVAVLGPVSASVQHVPSVPEVTLPALLIVPALLGLALLLLMGRARSRKRRPPTG